jgi:hypothetical protein
VVSMQKRRGRAVAVGILCSIAATVALWAGPLESASGSLHSAAAWHGQLSPASHPSR